MQRLRNIKQYMTWYTLMARNLSNQLSKYQLLQKDFAAFSELLTQLRTHLHQSQKISFICNDDYHVSESWKFDTKIYATCVAGNRELQFKEVSTYSNERVNSFTCVDSPLLQECQRDTAFPTEMVAATEDQRLSSSFQTGN